MIILRWIFVAAVVGFVLAALAVIDGAGQLVRVKPPARRTPPGSRLPRVVVRNS